MKQQEALSRGIVKSVRRVGLKAWFIFHPFPSSFYSVLMPSQGHYAIGSSFQAFLPLVINFPLFIILVLRDIAPFLGHAPILP